MDDPIKTYDFVKGIIDERGSDIVGLAVPRGNRLTLSKGKSKFEYILTLLLIMGFYYFLKNSFITIKHKILKKISKLGLVKDPTIIGYANSKGIETKLITSTNNKKFIEYLKSLDLDIIINQSQSFLKKQLLEIPKIGVLNRHNALLPKNRGRLTPFWVLFNNENRTGVSIHFVEEFLDSGDIVIQKEFKVSKNDNFNSLVNKNYKIASKAMIEALNLLEKKDYSLIENDCKKATYNTTPTLKEALKYRFRKIKIFQ